MEDLGSVFSAVIDILKIEFEIYGYPISFWNISTFSVFSGLLGWVVWEVLNRD